MLGAMAHRGPDGIGVAGRGPLALGCARLSISGPEFTSLPLTRGALALVYNGELYDRGARVRRPDTAWLLDRVAREGDAALDSLDGMFALAVGRLDGDRITLARDAFGIKPLWVRERPTELSFASELHALCPAGGARPEVSRDAVAELLALGGTVASDATLLAGVREIAAGATETWAWERGGLRVRTRDLPAPEREAPGLLPALEASVMACADTDRPLGLFLSGGIDSAAVAAILARNGVTGLQTFSLVLRDDGVSDLAQLELPGDAWRSWRHHAWTPSEGEIDSAFDAVLATTSRPCFPASAAYTLLLSQHAQAAGVRVVLAGEGADELFAGYDSYLGPLAQGGPVDDFYLRDRDMLALVAALLGDEPRRIETRLRDTLRGAADGKASSVARLLGLERQLSLRPLLARVDETSMACSLEVRLPYLHGAVPQLAARWAHATSRLGATTKPSLREALVPLLGERAREPKRPLRVPLAHWLAPGRPQRLAAALSDAGGHLPIESHALVALRGRLRAEPCPQLVTLALRLRQLATFCERFGTGAVAELPPAPAAA
jgi:asparagine synthase (glutamine-hydrolysing)